MFMPPGLLQTPQHMQAQSDSSSESGDDEDMSTIELSLIFIMYIVIGKRLFFRVSDVFLRAYCMH